MGFKLISYKVFFFDDKKIMDFYLWDFLPFLSNKYLILFNLSALNLVLDFFYLNRFFCAQAFWAFRKVGGIVMISSKLVALSLFDRA